MSQVETRCGMDIFEYTAFSLNCAYISDLRSVRITKTETDKIYTLPETPFPLSAYNQLTEYITGNHAQFPSITAAKEAIVQSFFSHPFETVPIRDAPQRETDRYPLPVSR